MRQCARARSGPRASSFGPLAVCRGHRNAFQHAVRVCACACMQVFASHTNVQTRMHSACVCVGGDKTACLQGNGLKRSCRLPIAAWQKRTYTHKQVQAQKQATIQLPPKRRAPMDPVESESAGHRRQVTCSIQLKTGPKNFCIAAAVLHIAQARMR